MSDSVADDELAAFVDRILRMKSEEDAIKSDIKEIYAEAKGRGYDKTRLGETVATVRKLEKDADGEAEKEAIRDLYLTAYFRAKNKPHTHAYARAAKVTTKNASIPAGFDAKTGEEVTTPIQPETANELPPASRGIAGEDDLRELAATVPGQIAQEGDAPLEASADVAGEGMSGHAAHLSTEFAEPDATPAGAVVADPSGVTGGESAASLYAAPGVITTEHSPPEGVKRHPYSMAFGEAGQDITQLRKDIHAEFGGVREPIVKIGPTILSGWARYNISRSMMIDYPVVQYGGEDALADVIRWNLESRKLSEADLKAIAGRLVKAAPDRAEDIHQMLGLEVGEGA